MKARASFLVVALALLPGVLGGCAEAPKNAARPAPPVVGADRDQHGCIGSAGYSWCARETACVRPWELAQQRGFVNDAEAFQRYCAGTSR
jgi:hypothetical protein